MIFILKRYYLIAGEAIDLHEANLISELSKLDKTAIYKGFGGDLMQKAGLELTKHYKNGIHRVLGSISEFLAILKKF